MSSKQFFLNNHLFYFIMSTSSLIGCSFNDDSASKDTRDVTIVLSFYAWVGCSVFISTFEVRGWE